jgi:hypothetical protein
LVADGRLEELVERKGRSWQGVGAMATAVAALGVALVAVAPVPAGAEVPGNVPAVSVNYHAMWSDYTDQERNAVLDRMVAAHVEWVRIDFGWRALEEHCRGCIGQWYVDRADRAVDAARARGLKVLMMFWMTPDWANGGRGPYVPPSDPREYAKRARWMAEHFRGRVDAWEVWNEPNEDYFWDGTASQYAAMLKAAYPAFKAGDPGATVVLGGPDYNDTGWLQSLYGAGVRGSFDVMATHPYQGQHDDPPETPDTDGDNIWLLTHVEAVHELMGRWGDGAKPIWFTEFGWSAHPNQGDEAPWEVGVTRQQQADYLIRTLRLVAERYPYVTNVFWYNERNRDSDNVQVNNYGLLRRDLSPKPAYRALKRFLTADVSSTAHLFILSEDWT